MKAHFDKLLLTFIFLVVFGTTTWLTLLGSMDEGALDWGRRTGDIISGSLLTLITGAVIRGIKDDPKP